MNTFHSRLVFAAALLAAPGLALAASESESNNPIGMANALTIGSDGTATVNGVIGNLSGPAVLDTDYFTFSGKEGDTVMLDIDGGMGGVRDVDTILAVFGPPPAYQVLRQNGDAGSLDPGSTSPLDARITNFTLPNTGTYTVGVSAFRRLFVNGGGTMDTVLRANPNGDYTLIISGVTPPLVQINIDIKPGNDSIAPINPKSKGKIPVALLGSSAFVVRDVDTSSLTFGHTGNEASLSKCNEASDVNGDVFPDMLCHFENQDAKFEATDDEAILRGKLGDGRQFEGRGWLKVVPAVKAPE